MKYCLVTGCAGFIGYHVALELQKRGDKVIGIDNFNDYYDPKLKRLRASKLKEAGIDVLEMDILDTEALVKLVDENSISHFIHLAAQAGVRYSLENPAAYTKTNIDGFLSVLETCRKRPHLKLTYASSSSVYGNKVETPFSENDPTDSQESLYGVTKKANELMARSYHNLFKISVTGLRFFTVYGPYGRPDMAYFSFAEKILKGEPISLYNNGDMLRDFTYIDDIVAGTIAAVDLESKLEIFNLGNHRPVKLKRFVEILEECLEKKAIIELKPMQQGDVVQTYADIGHSQRMLGFTPKTSLEIGLKHFANWFNDYAKNHLLLHR